MSATDSSLPPQAVTSLKAIGLGCEAQPTSRPSDENTADLFTKVLKRQPFEKHRKVVLNTGAGESTDEVKQQRVAALSAWKTKRVFHTKPQATSCKQTSHLCLRGERAWGETLD